ncbi:aquaporin [Williamsia serinedens]|uniref:Aquaporin Z n=1 Tax=Williamsia serinedens TaxID=391736 RepID=A0ABT1GX99_9NOCA|nr:aquaporin [Williamsia serinedens]MCP2159369.1 aquaporin Z [Williamsia serinedens]
MTDTQSRTQLLTPVLAEAIGTAVLVIGGVGTAVLAGKTVGTIGIALAFGLTLAALVYAIGPISGCHVNPAITLAMAIRRRISPVTAVGYVVAQVIGAIVGAAVVLLVASGRPGYSVDVDGLGTNGYGAQSTGGYGLLPVAVIEIVLTAVLVFVVFAATDSIATPAGAGVAIGATLVVAHLVAIGIDSTSVNPARSLGPALFAGRTALGHLWVFIVFPLVGGVVGALLHRAVSGREEAVAA